MFIPILILHCYIETYFCNDIKIRMKLKLSTNQVVIEHSKPSPSANSFHVNAPSWGSIFHSMNTWPSPWQIVKITAFTKKLHFNADLCSCLVFLREQKWNLLFFFLPYLQYVSLTIIHKFQFSVFCLLKKKTVEKATKSTMFLHIGFFIPLSPVYAGTELTVFLKRLPVLGSCYGFRSIFPWQMF